MLFSKTIIPPLMRGDSHFYRLVTAATAATTTASTVAKEEEHEADSDYNPDIFTVEKVTQAVHS